MIIASAFYIRVYDLGQRSLWLDEAWVANAVIQADLSMAIKRSLTSPLFFVLSVHYLALVLGKTEFVLRLLPCLFGFGTLIFFYLLSRKISGKTATLVTLFMLSFSHQFIHYSKELKQYSGAMFFTLLLVYFCEKILSSKRNKDWVLFSLFCVLGVGFDHSLLFVIPTVFFVLLVNLDFKKNWKKLVYSGSFVFIFSLLFFSIHILSQISNNIGAIQKYWLSCYPRLSSFSSFLNWLVSSFRGMFYYFGFPFFPVSLLIVLLGLSLFYKKSKRRYFLYIILPLVWVLTASFLKRYPFGGVRLMLFFAPLLYLAFGNGLDFIFKKLKYNRLYFPLICAVIFLSLSPASDFVQTIKHPHQLEEVRPLLNNVRTYIQPQDKIYVYYGAKEAFEFYYRTKFFEMIETKNIIWGKSHRDDIPKYSSDLNKYLYKDLRIWLVFSHYREKERASIISFIEKKGKRVREFHDPGAVAYLFQIQ
ncbi:MAG: glycosyltransferase family 39 protein [Acidobacteriota bacterium]